jgi:hypothetical protein
VCDYTTGIHFLGVEKELSVNVAIISTLTGCCQISRDMPEIEQLPKARQMVLELVINHITCLPLLLGVLIMIKIN